ncbi:MAG TPA: hypothetical protein VHW01_29570, partial [Polyangiaceae bacterium]|nr:hypothetical protein [Polyangiaceae bacterium]
MGNPSQPGTRGADIGVPKIATAMEPGHARINDAPAPSVYVEELRVSALTALDDSRDDHGGAEKRNARLPPPVTRAARFVDLPQGT